MLRRNGQILRRDAGGQCVRADADRAQVGPLLQLIAGQFDRTDPAQPAHSVVAGADHVAGLQRLDPARTKLGVDHGAAGKAGHAVGDRHIGGAVQYPHHRVGFCHRVKRDLVGCLPAIIRQDQQFGLAAQFGPEAARFRLPREHHEILVAILVRDDRSQIGRKACSCGDVKVPDGDIFRHDLLIVMMVILRIEIRIVVLDFDPVQRRVGEFDGLTDPVSPRSRGIAARGDRGRYG